MLDLAEQRIAHLLAEHQHYPYGTEVYLNVFRHFSHFPIDLKHFNTGLPGETVTYMALVVYECLNQKATNFLDLYETVLRKFNRLAADHLPQDITVETFLGCILFYYHSTNIRTALLTMDVNPILEPKFLYEYELKKRTILIDMV